MMTTVLCAHVGNVTHANSEDASVKRDSNGVSLCQGDETDLIIFDQYEPCAQELMKEVSRPPTRGGFWAMHISPLKPWQWKCSRSRIQYSAPVWFEGGNGL